MLKGKNLTELVAELDRRAAAKQDFIVDSRDLNLELVGENNTPVINVPGQGFYAPTDIAHGQLASKVDIPKRYYDRMRANQPQLLAENVNTWLHTSEKRHMVRTMQDDNSMRAFLSDRYRRIENEAIAQIVVPIAYDHESKPYPLHLDITDRKLYLTFLFDSLEFEVDGKGVLKPGFRVSNSEIGLGSYECSIFWYDTYCNNGLVFGQKDIAVTKRHLGGRVIDSSDYRIIQDDTAKAQDEALMLETRDMINAIGRREFLEPVVAKMRAATDGPKVQNPIKAVEVLGKDYGLSETLQQRTMESLIRRQDYSRWGMVSAVTEQANTAESFDHAADLEGLGGKLLDLDLNRWNKIAVAA